MTANFTNIGGLKVRAPVTVAGVAVGRVLGIKLDPKSFNAVVSCRSTAAIEEIPDDSTASILTSGILGEQYVGLDPGGSDTFLKNGSTIQYTQSALVLEKLIGQFFSKATAPEVNDAYATYIRIHRALALRLRWRSWPMARPPSAHTSGPGGAADRQGPVQQREQQEGRAGEEPPGTLRRGRQGARCRTSISITPRGWCWASIGAAPRADQRKAFQDAFYKYLVHSYADALVKGNYSERNVQVEAWQPGPMRAGRA